MKWHNDSRSSALRLLLLLSLTSQSLLWAIRETFVQPPPTGNFSLRGSAETPLSLVLQKLASKPRWSMAPSRVLSSPRARQQPGSTGRK